MGGIARRVWERCLIFLWDFDGLAVLGAKEGSRWDGLIVLALAIGQSGFMARATLRIRMRTAMDIEEH